MATDSALARTVRTSVNQLCFFLIALGAFVLLPSPI
jgi:hypothetical protein